ncbi:MAG: oxidoreductase, partial [bacterium]
GINEDNCRMMLAEGGGGLMDVGCYPVSLMRLAAGEEPVTCEAVGTIGKRSKVDHWAAGLMRFPGGAVAHFDCGMMVNTDWSVTIFGSAGKIKVTSPWVPGPAEARLEVTRSSDGKTETIAVPAKHIFANEAEAVARAIRAGKTQAPEMTWDDTLGNMRALDALRASMGLAWPQEKRKSKAR